MRTAKNILLFVFILIISLNVTVYAQENGEKTENPVKVTQEAENDKDVLHVVLGPFSGLVTGVLNGILLYLSSL